MSSSAAASLVPVADPPGDGISSIAFNPSPAHAAHLLTSSWDSTVRLYDVESMSPANPPVHLQSPVTKAVWAGAHDPTTVYATTIDGSLHQVNMNGGAQSVLGKHDQGLGCVVSCPGENVVYTGGWDSTLRVWDPRSSSPCVSNHLQMGKVLALDVTASDQALGAPLLVLATHNNKVLIYDRRDLSKSLQHRESQLRYMTRALRCTPDGEGFAMSSTEGRVAVEFFDASEASIARRFAFKCHRQQVEGVEHVYPVNDLVFHPKHTMTFASAGADGVVGIWDGIKKKRIRALPRQATSISSVSFSPTGDKLAMAVSYTWEEGDKEHPPESILIRCISDADVRPRK
ncbi:WD40 repeat-containing protein [Catenaria anguillulae PL171]|uniref:WD40 repeat-containing protein n=1 Tax=Catenaria anguillulae PL171 TaxID=765915 RepID=A0A1Y2HZL8_9FUNG|nr:WD40 repeat-containing protein [Catenaria anguillulae PL171]